MLRHPTIALLALCCFAVASALPSFAAVLPAENGTISIVICSADGFKTIEVEEESNDAGTESQHLCDVCQVHCGTGPAAQLAGWAFPKDQGSANDVPAGDRQAPRMVAGETKLPRGPPLSAVRLSRRT